MKLYVTQNLLKRIICWPKTLEIFAFGRMACRCQPPETFSAAIKDTVFRLSENRFDSSDSKVNDGTLPPQ